MDIWKPTDRQTEVGTCLSLCVGCWASVQRRIKSGMAEGVWRGCPQAGDAFCIIHRSPPRFSSRPAPSYSRYQRHRLGFNRHTCFQLTTCFSSGILDQRSRTSASVGRCQESHDHDDVEKLCEEHADAGDVSGEAQHSQSGSSRGTSCATPCVWSHNRVEESNYIQIIGNEYLTCLCWELAWFGYRVPTLACLHDSSYLFCGNSTPENCWFKAQPAWERIQIR